MNIRTGNVEVDPFITGMSAAIRSARTSSPPASSSPPPHAATVNTAAMSHATARMAPPLVRQAILDAAVRNLDFEAPSPTAERDNG